METSFLCNILLLHSQQNPTGESFVLINVKFSYLELTSSQNKRLFFPFQSRTCLSNKIGIILLSVFFLLTMEMKRIFTDNFSGNNIYPA